MHYIYLIEKSMSSLFYHGNCIGIAGCFTNKKQAIAALKFALSLKREEDIERHRTYVGWKSPRSCFVERYYRIIKVKTNKYREPNSLSLIDGEVVVLFPDLKDEKEIK